MDDPGISDPHPTGPRSGTGESPSDPGPLTTDPASAGDPPPFGASWNALYVVVAGTLVLLIALFSLFTRAFE